LLLGEQFVEQAVVGLSTSASSAVMPEGLGAQALGLSFAAARRKPRT